jgi:hypothetical protein
MYLRKSRGMALNARKKPVVTTPIPDMAIKMISVPSLIVAPLLFMVAAVDVKPHEGQDGNH